jgi:hypothetical protein
MSNGPNAGWFDDTTGRNFRRYWDGERWTDHVQRHDGSSGSDPLGGAAPEAMTAATPPVSPPTAGPIEASDPRPATTWWATASTTTKILAGGLAVALVAIMLPWESDTTTSGETINATPSDTGQLPYLLVLIALAGWAAWPTLSGTLSLKRRIGLAVVVAVLSLFAIGKFAALGDAQSEIDEGSSTPDFTDEAGNFDLDMDDYFGSGIEEYAPGFGLFLFSGALVALWVGVARVWLAPTPETHPTAAPTAPPPATF